MSYSSTVRTASSFNPQIGWHSSSPPKLDTHVGLMRFTKACPELYLARLSLDFGTSSAWRWCAFGLRAPNAGFPLLLVGEMPSRLTVDISFVVGPYGSPRNQCVAVTRRCCKSVANFAVGRRPPCSPCRGSVAVKQPSVIGV